jgi:signal transduction histidine kinase
MMAMETASPEDYQQVLEAYVQTRHEAALYRASLLSAALVQAALGPEDIVSLHMEALDRITAEMPPRDQVRAVSDAHQFLLEIMIGYGVHYREYLELRLEEGLREADARLAREQEHALEAERIGREKGEILGVIAHELRTPITAAKANLELAERLLLQGQIERVPRLLSPARSAVDRLSRLTADLVEASRDEPPALEFTRQDLTPLISQACAWVEPSAQSAGVALIRDGDEGSLPVQGNADALLSVLANVLANATRYTPAGGEVRVTQGVQGAEVWVEVRDTGIGMTPETVTHVFDKFYRGPEARRVEPRGLGLGLSLVRQLIDAHHGRVEIETAPGQGTAFRILLPGVAMQDPQI